MSTTRGPRPLWEIPGQARRLLVATPADHLLPAIRRIAVQLRMAVESTPGLLEVVDDRGGPRIDRLFHRLARELTAAETEAVRVAADPPERGTPRVTALLTAPTLAVELARRGITAEVGVLTEAQFHSVYQPIVSLADREPVAHEALLRGVVDGREVGGGDLFFVAEAAGWLSRLDEISRESAITGAVPWLESHDLFLNFSPGSILRPQVSLADTERLAHDSGIAARQLVFEVVESHAAADRGHLLSVLEHLRSLGWRVAVDDVSAGWSSRSLLGAVRPDVVKLSKALVQALPDEGVRAVIRALVEHAHSLKAVVVAEGVETERLADEVTALGADLGQGWLFGRPVRPEPQVEEPTGGWQPAVISR